MGTSNSSFDLQAMLYTLLNDNFKPDESIPKVFYIQPKAILKLFKLQVGNERVSSQHIIQRMIRRFVSNITV